MEVCMVWWISSMVASGGCDGSMMAVGEVRESMVGMVVVWCGGVGTVFAREGV